MRPALHAKAQARSLSRVHHRFHIAHVRALAGGMQQFPAQELAPDVEALIKSIHANQTKAVVYATGGAVQSISWLLSVPGASATVLEAAVPYARDSLVDVLGQEPEQYCSAATARAMAEAAYRRAANLCAFGSSFVGLGATCSLATVPLKRGEHRAFVALHSASGSTCVGLTLAKGARSRVGEDDLVSRLLVKMLAEATGCDTSAFHLPLIDPASSSAPPPPPPAPDAAGPTTAAPESHTHRISRTGASAQAPSTPHTAGHQSTAAAQLAADAGGCSSGRGDVVVEERLPAGDPLARLLRGEVRCVEFCGGEVAVDAPRRGRVYLPGSFNPLHDGHRRLLEVAVSTASAAAGGAALEGAFELTIENADKGLLAESEVRRRVAQFTELGLPVVVTRAPLFTIKANLLPGSRFVVGYDTAVRLVLPKYYGNSYTQMVLDFARLRHQGCSFLVAGRKDGGSGRFMGLADVDMPPELADLFPVALPEEAFRMDISSTELRQRAQLQGQEAGQGREREAQQAQQEHVEARARG